MVSCDCHRQQMYDHCEKCSDDEFLQMFHVDDDEVDVAFEMIRGKMNPSRRAKRLYKILKKKSLITNRTDKTLIKIVHMLKGNFNVYRCRTDCEKCIPIVVEYDESYRDFIKRNDNDDDSDMTSFSFDASKYIQSVITEDLQNKSKTELVDLLFNIKRMCCEDKF